MEWLNKQEYNVFINWLPHPWFEIWKDKPTKGTIHRKRNKETTFEKGWIFRVGNKKILHAHIEPRKKIESFYHIYKKKKKKLILEIIFLKLLLSYLEKRVPQSHLYSLVPQVLECAFQSDWTAYFFEHLSHFHFFSPCFLQKCFLIPVRSPNALDGSWCTQLVSGHTYTFFLISLLVLCFSFHGRLCPLLWSCRFWSLWNPLLQISHTNLFVAIRVLGDKAITSAPGSVLIQFPQNKNIKQEFHFLDMIGVLIWIYHICYHKDKNWTWVAWLISLLLDYCCCCWLGLRLKIVRWIDGAINVWRNTCCSFTRCRGQIGHVFFNMRQALHHFLSLQAITSAERERESSYKCKCVAS